MQIMQCLQSSRYIQLNSSLGLTSFYESTPPTNTQQDNGKARTIIIWGKCYKHPFNSINILISNSHFKGKSMKLFQHSCEIPKMPRIETFFSHTMDKVYDVFYYFIWPETLNKLRQSKTAWTNSKASHKKCFKVLFVLKFLRFRFELFAQKQKKMVSFQKVMYCLTSEI